MKRESIGTITTKSGVEIPIEDVRRFYRKSENKALMQLLGVKSNVTLTKILQAAKIELKGKGNRKSKVGVKLNIISDED
jgi:hypothetical protein